MSLLGSQDQPKSGLVKRGVSNRLEEPALSESFCFYFGSLFLFFCLFVVCLYFHWLV